jgi:hypothetical protein
MSNEYCIIYVSRQNTLEKGVGVSLSIYCLLIHFCHTDSINDIYITYVSKIEYFINVFFVFAVITHKRVLLYSERRQSEGRVTVHFYSPTHEGSIIPDFSG